MKILFHQYSRSLVVWIANRGWLLCVNGGTPRGLKIFEGIGRPTLCQTTGNIILYVLSVLAAPQNYLSSVMGVVDALPSEFSTKHCI